VHNAIDESDDFGDIDTSDLFTEISRGVDHQLWLVESHRQLYQQNVASVSAGIVGSGLRPGHGPRPWAEVPLAAE
jgi:hypothetical protein